VRILIAEDNANPLLIHQKAITHFGYECIAANDGAEAWMLLPCGHFDVVISDWMMPGMDGLELCRRIRSLPGPLYTYFIFLTALADRSDVLKGIVAGADDYLTKPLDPEELQIRLLVASRVTNLHRQLAQQAEQLKNLNQRFFEQGRTDSLTPLGNRLRLREDLDMLSNPAKRREQSYCAIICDVDLFKKYNDIYGHLAGDEVLRAVGEMIARSCRSGDTAYRYGGEEFLVILREQTVETAAVAADRLRQGVASLAIEHRANEPTRTVTISAGVSIFSAENGTTTIMEWLKQADQALYQAKQNGRNQVILRDQYASLVNAGSIDQQVPKLPQRNRQLPS
jgi:diguanylate cyclase (GGDEF)-like protein